MVTRIILHVIYISNLLLEHSPHAHREVVTDLIEEYRAAERPDYVTWGGSSSVSGGGGGDHPRTSSTTDMRIRDDIGDDM